MHTWRPSARDQGKCASHPAALLADPTMALCPCGVMGPGQQPLWAVSQRREPCSGGHPSSPAMWHPKAEGILVEGPVVCLQLASPQASNMGSKQCSCAAGIQSQPDAGAPVLSSLSSTYRPEASVPDTGHLWLEFSHPVESLALTVEEVVDVRRVLVKAEMEKFVQDKELFSSLKRGKVRRLDKGRLGVLQEPAARGAVNILRSSRLFLPGLLLLQGPVLAVHLATDLSLLQEVSLTWHGGHM
ncbi:Protein spire like protein 2 [Fukomys damarensis]|uniref:Protein spire like protein 2 n=1 Tax=Fukomys damarensis TaxID=885580 RepID=A0A091E2D5_FUKDA|nr:Protein spire like protein 2 [Fukomys damarensis]